MPRILILDEPTAVLAPQEVDQLFAALRRLQETGLSVVFITHKLHEVMSITNHITVLRHGQVAGSVATAETTERGAGPDDGRPGDHALGETAGGQIRRRGPLGLQDVHADDNKGVAALRGINARRARRAKSWAWPVSPATDRPNWPRCWTARAGATRARCHGGGPGCHQRRPADHHGGRRGAHPRGSPCQRGRRADRGAEHGAGASGRVRQRAARSTASGCVPTPRR